MLITIFGGVVSLSPVQIADYNLTVNGSATNGGTLVFPSGISGQWNITNNTGSSIAVKYPGQATPLTIAPAASEVVSGNGNALTAAANQGGPTTTPVPVAQGGTGGNGAPRLIAVSGTPFAVYGNSSNYYPLGSVTIPGNTIAPNSLLRLTVLYDASAAQGGWATQINIRRVSDRQDVLYVNEVRAVDGGELRVQRLDCIPVATVDGLIRGRRAAYDKIFHASVKVATAAAMSERHWAGVRKSLRHISNMHCVDLPRTVSLRIRVRIWELV
jgi:hypothetical protein